MCWGSNVLYYMACVIVVRIKRLFGLAYVREGRPLAYRGRIAEPMTVAEASEKVWKQSQLFSSGFTDAAEQLAARDMEIVEDPPHALVCFACLSLPRFAWSYATHMQCMCVFHGLPPNLHGEDVSEQALPSTTDGRAVTIQAAQKFQQIGKDAGQRLLGALLQGAALPPRQSLVLRFVLPCETQSSSCLHCMFSPFRNI